MYPVTGACPGICKRGGPKSESLFFFFFVFFFFFFCFSIFQGGGPAQKLAEKMIFSTKKVAKYRWNSLIFALMTFFFFCFSISRGGPGPLGPPPWTRAWVKLNTILLVQYNVTLFCVLYLWRNCPWGNSLRGNVWGELSGGDMSEKKWPEGYVREGNNLDPIIIHLEINYIM